MIRRQVLLLHRSRGERADEDFRGLYISDEDVEAMLDPAGSIPTLISPGPAQTPQLEALERAIVAARERAAVLEAEGASRLVQLSERFQLSPLERAIVLIGLSIEVERKYERLFAYLQDDVSRKRPSADLALRLLCPTLEQRLRARAVFEPGAPLLHWRLITLADPAGARHTPLLSQTISLDERVVRHLLGRDRPDERLAPLIPTERGGVAPVPPAFEERLDTWIQSLSGPRSPGPQLLLLHGRYGSGRRAAALKLAGSLQRPLLTMDAAALRAVDLDLETAFRLVERESMLSGALVCWLNVDGLLAPAKGEEAASRDFLRALERGQTPALLIAERVWEPPRALSGRPFVRLSLPDTSYDERRSLWSTHLAELDCAMDAAEIDGLSGRFRLSAGQVRDAAARARTLAWSRDPERAVVRLEDVEAACRAQAQHRLGALARKVETRHRWEDIVLAPQQSATLLQMAATVRQRPTVYGDWGFDQKLAMGKGVIALFTGPPGTGKTMAAGILARELSLDLYKVEISSVVSKYIGETEKNLEQIFSEAQDSDAVLFFDEADALFGKRSDVSDARDRYANIEIAYLLQRTEEYDGMVILASNLRNNIDEAFVRRLHFAVEFPFPEETERLSIWRRGFPDRAPRDPDLDLPFLARQFKLAGGSIRNATLAAAFLAAEEGVNIGMRHLVLGVAHELQKIGKLVVASDFQHHYDLVSEQT